MFSKNKHNLQRTFWLWPISRFGHLMITQVQTTIHFTLLIQNWPSPFTAFLLAVSTSTLAGKKCRLRGGTLSGELHTSPLLVLHVTVGYLWSHTRSWRFHCWKA